MNPDDPAVQAELDQWFRIEVWSGFTLDDPSWVDRLEATCAEFKPAVAYVDVWRKVTAKDINMQVEMAPLLASLDAIRRAHGTVFRIVHHYRKQQGFRTGRGSQEMGGSFVLGAWGECSLFFEPIGRKQGAVRVEVQVKDGPPVPGFTLTLYSEGPAHAATVVRLVAEDTADEDDADEVVFQAVATLPKTEAAVGRPGATVQALVTALRRSDKTIRRALKRLVVAKRVMVTGKLSNRADLYAVNAE